MQLCVDAAGYGPQGRAAPPQGTRQDGAAERRPWGLWGHVGCVLVAHWAAWDCTESPETEGCVLKGSTPRVHALLYRWGGVTWECMESPPERPRTWTAWLQKGCCSPASTPPTLCAHRVSLCHCPTVGLAVPVTSGQPWLCRGWPAGPGYCLSSSRSTSGPRDCSVLLEEWLSLLPLEVTPAREEVTWVEKPQLERGYTDSYRQCAGCPMACRAGHTFGTA